MVILFQILQTLLIFLFVVVLSTMAVTAKTKHVVVFPDLAAYDSSHRRQVSRYRSFARRGSYTSRLLARTG